MGYAVLTKKQLGLALLFSCAVLEAQAAAVPHSDKPFVTCSEEAAEGVNITCPDDKNLWKKCLLIVGCTILAITVLLLVCCCNPHARRQRRMNDPFQSQKPSLVIDPSSHGNPKDAPAIPSDEVPKSTWSDGHPSVISEVPPAYNAATSLAPSITKLN